MEQYDYCIIGGGVLGCAIGKTLLEQQPQASILIVEKNAAAGQGNTIRSNAAYRNIFDTDINIQLSASSIKYYQDQEEDGEDFGRRQIGYLFLLTAEQYDNYNRPSLEYQDEILSFFEFLKSHQIQYEIYNQQQLQKMFPELVVEPDSEIAMLIDAKPIKYGFLGTQCGNFSPDRVVLHYLNQYLQLGGVIQYHTTVVGLKLGSKNAEFDPEYISKVWDEQEVKAIKVLQQNQTSYIQANQFIVATGAWVNELLEPLGLRSLVKAKKRQLFTINNVKEFISNSNFSQQHHVFPFTILPTGGVFLKPKAEANAVVIGTSDVIGRRYESTSPADYRSNLDDPQAEEEFYIHNILPILQSYFPSVFDEHTQIKGSAGFYAYSVDKYPVIERVPELSNLVFVSGASGSGIMKADSIARIATASILKADIAKLYNGVEIDISRFGIKHRNLPDETLVL